MKKSLIFLLFLVFLFPVESYAGNFFITSYDFNDNDASTIASKYDVIVTNLSKSSAVSTIKSFNPSLKAFWYRDSLCYGNSYPVLDTVTGNRVHRNGWGWELQDISNSSYRTYLANYIADYLTNRPQFDGVFLDDVLHDLYETDFHDAVTGLQAHLPSNLTNQTNWRSYMVSLLSAVKSAIGSKLAIINANFYRTEYIAVVDGIFDEWFAHPNWDDANTWNNDGVWKDSVDSLASVANSNKYFLAQSGVSDGATQAQINKLVRYSFSSFLMGIPPNNSFAKHYFCPSMTYSNYYWYSDWTANLGNPTGDYFQIQGTNFYRRNFEKGIVMVNPTNQTGKVGLEKTYCLLGQSVSEINFSDHEGVILLNCDTIPPAPPTNLLVN